jgi:dihydrofolate synthase / folylpolyglutamate synthase
MAIYPIVTHPCIVPVQESPIETPHNPFPTFDDVAGFEAYLDGLGQFRMELDLGRILLCLQRLGRDTPFCTTARVVGTNGKGSTSYLLARLAAVHGLRVGLFTSPHFLHTRERVLLLEEGRIAPPADATWLDLARTVFTAGPAGMPGASQGLTYFEFLLAMAVEYFARQRVDLAVFEAGLGARYDAVAALPSDLLLLTSIGLDHTKQLGPDLPSVAAEKAWALRQGARLALSTAQSPEAWQQLERASSESDTPLLAVNQTPPPSLDVGAILALRGPHQRANARLAVAGCQTLLAWKGAAYDWQRCASVLRQAALPGRFQAVPALPGVHPHLLLDGAHNPDGLDALCLTLKTEDIRPKACIAAVMRDKPLEAMATHLTGMASGPVLLPRLPALDRQMPPEELAPLLEARDSRARVTIVDDLSSALRSAEALETSAREPVLICGSLYLLAEFFKLRPDLVRFV